MSRFTLFLVLASAMIGLGSGSPLSAQNDPAAATAVDSTKLVLPLVYRTPDQRALLVMNVAEIDPLKKILLDNQIKYDQLDWFDTKYQDYSEYHLIVGGSNCMDGFGNAKAPADFDPLERFVANGGHLMIFGTFNGRNSEHLQRFGISTGFFHGHKYREVPQRTELLFKGFEAIIPPENKMTSAGNFAVSTPHVTLLQRGEGDSYPDQPALVTLAYKMGRVTFTQVEPWYQNDSWLYTVMTTWAVRGGPTSVEQLDQQVVLDKQEIIERRKMPVPTDSDLQTAEQAIREKMRDDMTLATTSADKMILGDRLVQMSQTEVNPASIFVSLKLARDFYTDAISPVKAFDAINQMNTFFQLDIAEMSLATAKSLSEKIQDPAGSAEFAKTCLDLADDLADKGRYDIAISITELAKTAAQTGKHKHFLSLIPPLLRRLAVLQKESDRIQTFRDRLKANDKDAEANLELGKFHCLYVRNWEAGLLQLAKGNDEAYRQLAEAEIKGTDDPNAQVAVAELWTVQSKRLTATARAAAQSRARTWYWHAISKSSGSQRTALERKADKIFTNKFELRLAFSHDGHTELHVSKDRLQWKPFNGSPPTSIQANNQYWPVASQHELRNHGSTRYFPEEVDLETAEIIQVRGPVKVALTTISPEQLVIDLNGNRDVEFVIKFGR